MKITIVLEDQELESGSLTVKAGVSIDPKPDAATPETPASTLANRLWGVVMQEQKRLEQKKSAIIGPDGEPIGFMQGVCESCQKTFRRAFSETTKCPECSEPN